MKERVYALREAIIDNNLEYVQIIVEPFLNTPPLLAQLLFHESLPALKFTAGNPKEYDAIGLAAAMTFGRYGHFFHPRLKSRDRKNVKGLTLKQTCGQF